MLHMFRFVSYVYKWTFLKETYTLWHVQQKTNEMLQKKKAFQNTQGDLFFPRTHISLVCEILHVHKGRGVYCKIFFPFVQFWFFKDIILQWSKILLVMFVSYRKEHKSGLLYIVVWDLKNVFIVLKEIHLFKVYYSLVSRI
jgi:hypothetical protein